MGLIEEQINADLKYNQFLLHTILNILVLKVIYMAVFF